MAHPLARLLELRQMIEEAGRVELEARAALSSQIELAQARERGNARESRERALAAMRTGPEAGPDANLKQADLEAGRVWSLEDGPRSGERTMEWAAAERSLARERALDPLARVAARRVAEGREEYYERRKQRRQVESVLDAARERLRVERERRTQRELDDWFGMRRARGRGKSWTGGPF